MRAFQPSMDPNGIQLVYDFISVCYSVINRSRYMLHFSDSVAIDKKIFVTMFFYGNSSVNFCEL